MIDLALQWTREIHFRGKLRLFGAFVPKAGERSARLFGNNIKLDLSDDIQRWMYLGCFEPEETSLVRGYLKPGMVFLDVGANVGYFTLLASSLVGPSGRIISVEPSPSCGERLAATVRNNALANITIERMGLSHHHGQTTLYVPCADARNHSPSMIPNSDHEAISVEVPVRTLDEMLTQWQITSIDLMKIDVEGYEPAVFRGARKALEERRIRAILCEFNAHYLSAAGSSTQELYDLLIDAGFYDVDAPSFREDIPLQNRFFQLAEDNVAR